MSTLQELMAQKAEIEKQIEAHKPEAIAAIKSAMAASGVTLADLGGVPRSGSTGAKRPIKYRDPQGNTWTGIGQRPRWVRKALSGGATLEQFAVKG